MCAILLSINPEHVNNILSGKKIYEFRKTECKRQVDKIIIYSTCPVMEIVGEADVEDILTGTPDYIWNITHKKAGVNKNFFYKYYRNKTKAVAYKLHNVKKYDKPKKLKDFGIKKAPQSFQYV